jgi:hypothetical protein
VYPVRLARSAGKRQPQAVSGDLKSLAVTCSCVAAGAGRSLNRGVLMRSALCSSCRTPAHVGQRSAGAFKLDQHLRASLELAKQAMLSRSRTDRSAVSRSVADAGRPGQRYREKSITVCRSVKGSCPATSASLASMAGRTMEGPGNPALRRSDISTSSGQRRCPALVIIRTQSSTGMPGAAWCAATSAGRRY